MTAMLARPRPARPPLSPSEPPLSTPAIRPSTAPIAITAPSPSASTPNLSPGSATYRPGRPPGSLAAARLAHGTSPPKPTAEASSVSPRIYASQTVVTVPSATHSSKSPQLSATTPSQTSPSVKDATVDTSPKIAEKEDHLDTNPSQLSVKAPETPSITATISTAKEESSSSHSTAQPSLIEPSSKQPSTSPALSATSLSSDRDAASTSASPQLSASTSPQLSSSAPSPLWSAEVLSQTESSEKPPEQPAAVTSQRPKYRDFRYDTEPEEPPAPVPTTSQRPKYRDFRYDTEPEEPPARPTRIQLNSGWDWWYDLRQMSSAAMARRSNEAAAYAQNLVRFGTFATIPGFWSFYNNMRLASELPSGSNLHLFRAGIKPMWEDPANHRGAQFQFHLAKGSADQLWITLLLSVIGETMIDSDETDILGLIFQKRQKGDRICIWIRDRDNAAVKEGISNYLSKLQQKFIYEPHPDQH